MSDFHTSRSNLSQARQSKENLRRNLFLTREKAKRLQTQLALLDRSFDPQDQAMVARRNTLTNQIADVSNDISKISDAHSRAIGAEIKHFQAFMAFSDPRQNVEELTDNLPILMMPLRIETRFKDVKLKDGSSRPYLWVRVFPDDWAVDNFEGDLSEVELDNAQVYWAAHWKAGGFEEDERAAWRSLVANHGTGRSGWIISQYRPDNEADQPVKANRQDVVLVIRTDNPPPAAVQAAATVFWQNAWKAGTDQGSIDAAWQALITDIGQANAEVVRDRFVPVNFTDEPLAPYGRDEVQVTLSWLEIPSAEEWDAKTDSWTQQARAHILPDRFVLRLMRGENTREVIGAQIPSPLALGPDPAAEPDEQLSKEDGELKVPDGLKWMVDFDEAVAKGMGFRVPLDAAERRGGFDKLMVVGVRMANDEQESQQLLETLIDHHHYSLTDFSLLPQGTPTNNTEDLDSGYSYQDDADSSFHRYVKEEDQFNDSEDWMAKKDGQWLAEWLGLNTDVMKRVAFSGGTDQSESRAMNTALWPATLGYTMESMMSEVFSEQTTEMTRAFFTKLVVPRGIVPAIRIGEQPYGILPATAWSRMEWLRGRTGPVISSQSSSSIGNMGGYLPAIYSLLKKIDADWGEMSEQVSFVGKSGDAHQNLLDILGLHPSSVEFYQRYSQSIEQFVNSMSFNGSIGKIIAWLISGAYIKSGMDLLARLGAKVTDEQGPEILKKLFLQSENLLNGPIIDDQPLSESAGIRDYTDDNQNYIDWLIKAAETSLDELRKQSGFTDNKRPRALLYNYLRHALQLSYWEASLKLLSSPDNPILSKEYVRRAKIEPKFLHVQGVNDVSESKYQQLYRTAPELTGHPQMTVGEYIPSVIKTSGATAYLKEQLEALEYLKDVPTAHLDRAFSEHIDACTYRLDAWQQALIHYQLLRMRYVSDPTNGQNSTRQGIHLGAYGYLEAVRPENKVLTPVKLDKELDDLFNPSGQPPLVSDNKNQGFVHAPSLNHAVTASVLRNGYLSNATPQSPDALSVNLSSERVRLGMGVLEGLRNGQRLGALLGYQLERDLHDNHQLAETDEFIFDLRKAFSLAGNRIGRTKVSDEDMEDLTIGAIESRNVVDGLKLAEHIQRTGNKTYPFGKPKLPPASPAQAAKINAAVDRMLNIKDATADLAIAESVHQTVLGNYDRAAGNLDAVGKGNLPPVPDVVQTPRSGITLTHRVTLSLDSQAGSKGSPWTGISMSPRALAEPSLNRWLAGLLPDPANMVAMVHRSDTDTTVPISIDDLGIQAIDLLFMLRMEGEQAMADLDDRLLDQAIAQAGGSVRADTVWSLRYTEASPDSNHITLFQLAPLMESLRKLGLSSRELKASDMSLQNEASDGQDVHATIDPALIQNGINGLEAQLPALDGYLATLGALLDDPETNLAALITGIDTHLDDYLSLAQAAMPFGIPEASTGFGYDWKKKYFEDLDARIQAKVDAWTTRANDFDLLMGGYGGLGNNEDRFALLQKAERLISTSVTTPLPPAPATFQGDLQAHRVLFGNKINTLTALLSLSSSQVSAYNSGLSAALPLTDFDWEAFDLSKEEQRMLTFSQELLTRASTLRKVIFDRAEAAKAHLLAYGATASPPEKVAALKNGGKAIFGEDFQIIPHFTLSEVQGMELENVQAHIGDLLDHQLNTLNRPFPVDEWLYGMARVRQKLNHWERATMIAEGFSAAQMDLVPMQLPYQANDSWLALEFPETYEINSDKLLLSMHQAEPFDRNLSQCGLILDEWTEVIPTREETTGVAFHYDKPNSEPAQVMLLLTPTQFGGGWEWADIVDGIEETFDRAKKRAVEPEQLEKTAYARFSPATLMAVTMHPITIATNLAVVNGIEAKLNNEDDA